MALIKHIAIITDDPERLANYYVDVFGLTITKSLDGSFWITDGYMDIALQPHSHPANAKSATGIKHWGFTVDAEERDRIHAKNEEYGIKRGDVIDDPTRPYVEEKCFDVDGNKFDLSTTGVRDTAEPAASA